MIYPCYENMLIHPYILICSVRICLNACSDPTVCNSSQFLLGLHDYRIVKHVEFSVVQNGISQGVFSVYLPEVRERHCPASTE